MNVRLGLQMWGVMSSSERGRELQGSCKSMRDRIAHSPLPKHKIGKTPEYRVVYYSEDRWGFLSTLRHSAARLMEVLINCGFDPVVHGSLARGDVDVNSDVDIVIPYNIQPYEVELCLERSKLTPTSKYVIQATPSSSLKAYIELDLNGFKNISFPLTPLTPREYEFYRFGGSISYQDLIKNVRVPGVNKQLILVIPTEYGHDEYPVIGYEGYVAKVVGVSVETVRERVEVLSRRNHLGRTGVYLNYPLTINEGFDEALSTLLKGRKHKRSNTKL